MLNITTRQYNPQLEIPNLIKEEINYAKKILSSSLQEAGFKQYEIVETGSLICGHYNGPKPKHYSLNDKCPFESVIECDLRVILPNSVDVLSRSFKNAIEDTTLIKPEFTVQKELQRFGALIPMMMGYYYTPITEDLGLEFEICFNQSPYFEIANVWNKVFSSEEIEHQRLVRQLAANLNLDYKTDFYEIKSIQASECRYRLCGLVSYYPEYINLYQYSPDLVNYLSSKVEGNFLAIERPTLGKNLNREIKNKFKDAGMLDFILDSPSIPRWLSEIEALKYFKLAS